MLGRRPGNACLFSRVPKVGSETIWKLLDALAGKNHFKSYSDSQV